MPAWLFSMLYAIVGWGNKEAVQRSGIQPYHLWLMVIWEGLRNYLALLA